MSEEEEIKPRKKGSGGKRPGAGQPSMKEKTGRAVVSVHVTVFEDQAGTTSAEIREAIDQYKKAN